MYMDPIDPLSRVIKAYYGPHYVNMKTKTLETEVPHQNTQR